MMTIPEALGMALTALNIQAAAMHGWSTIHEHHIEAIIVIEELQKRLTEVAPGLNPMNLLEALTIALESIQQLQAEPLRDPPPSYAEYQALLAKQTQYALAHDILANHIANLAALANGQPPIPPPPGLVTYPGRDE